MYYIKIKKGYQSLLKSKGIFQTFKWGRTYSFWRMQAQINQNYVFSQPEKCPSLELRQLILLNCGILGTL